MTWKSKAERSKSVAEAVAQVKAERLAKGLCRHCGGSVPCWSSFGDVSVGVRFDEEKKEVTHL